jgi:hypothetical protein
MTGQRPEAFVAGVGSVSTENRQSMNNAVTHYESPADIASRALGECLTVSEPVAGAAAVGERHG